MNQNLTAIAIILDRSGSMASVHADTIGGFNTFVAEQKKLPGEAIVSLAQFNNRYELTHDGVRLAQVPDLTGDSYVPSGGTALFDALGKTINALGAKLAAMPEAERPAKVLVLVMTDGEENSSKEFTREQVHAMVTHQREVYGWEFAFIGANLDAIKAATSVGVSASNAMQYESSKEGTSKALRSMNAAVGSYRTGNTSRREGLFGSKP